MSMPFVHLHLHTEYSLEDGLLRIKPLVKRCAEMGMPAMAVTDLGNLFAMVKFYRAAQAEGIKPIIGAEVRVKKDGGSARLVLLCQNEEGYRHLTRLISRSYLEGWQGGHPLIEGAWLEGMTSGLIALSAGREGDIGQTLLKGDRDRAMRLMEGWLGLFPHRFYLELQRTGREGEEDYIDGALDLAMAFDAPVVATNDVRFLHPGDFEAHEARVCIHQGVTLDDPRRRRNYSEQQYLRSPEEMEALFSDIPEALLNTVAVAKRCNLELRLGEVHLPDFPIPPGTTPEAYLKERAEEGLKRRLVKVPKEKHGAYGARLQRELGVIEAMGFPGYFLIVADFIQWAKDHGIPVGPGRGSGAGSLVAYALGITELDPIRYELLFERFLNPERVSLPDFDVDFCMENRDRVIEYVAQRYGRDRVAQIITYGSMAAKAVVRDVGRVLGYPYGFVDKIAKLIPFEIGMTLDKAMGREELLKKRYAEEEEVRVLIDLARSLEGLARNAGKHAGGVVIAPAPLTDFMPLYREEGEDGVVTQLDKDDLEAMGLVKFDFLGLRTLTVIQRTVELARKREPGLDMGAVSLEDAETFALIQEGRTTAVFQLESRGMKELIRRLRPDCFEDIVALVALFRPGPLQSGMVDDFIDRKHGRASIAYPHPSLEPILKPTYGVILYQEQVMQIARDLAGYTLGQADLLRRSMGKKKPEEMAKQRAVFVKGAVERGVEEGTAQHIFDLMEKFAGYGFNRSHSAAYALLSYQTAWLKAHYPAEFMAAVLSSDMDNTDKVVGLLEECKGMGLSVLPPDIQASDHAFTVTDGTTLRYGLGAIKGVGAAALEGILKARDAPFEDLFDFVRRIDTRKANRRVLEALIRAGALDSLGANRATLMANLPKALNLAEQQLMDHAVGQDDLFGSLGALPQATLEPVPEWSEEERLRGEKETLGCYLSGHPLTPFKEELSHFAAASLAELSSDQGEVVVAGWVVGLRTLNTKRGGRLAFVTLDDGSARLEVSVFPEVFQQYRDRIAKDRLLIAQGKIAADDYTGGLKVVAEHLYDLDGARGQWARRLVIACDASIEVDALASVLAPFREGPCPVVLDYRNQSARATIALGKAWRVHPKEKLLQALRERWGPSCVSIHYEIPPEKPTFLNVG